MTKKLFLCAALAGFLVEGCVSAGKHEKLQQDYDKTNSELSACKAQVATDEAKIREAEDKLHASDVVVKDLEAKLGSTSSAKHKLEGDVAEMRAAMDALNKQRSESEKRIQEFRDFVKKFKSLTDTGKLTVKIVNGQMVVTMSSDVLFASGSAHLSKAGTEAVEQVTTLLNSVPDRKFQVEGFTDNVPIKTASFPSNWELASARALTVVKTMMEAGMPADRVSAASFGDTHPVQSNDTETGKKANRRIEIVVVPDLSTLPGYDELQKMASP